MLSENSLTSEEYIEIINTVGWKISSKRLLEKSLKNSMTIKYIINNETVGMARLITDGGYFGFIADVVVKPNFQGQGIGKKMINNLLDRAKDNLEENEEMIIELLASKGKSNFYQKFGFKDKKENIDAGMYMWLNK